MGSQTLEILRQGIWASFTGGWFFDPHQEIFCNTFHMYLWLCLLLAPFILHLTSTSVIIPTVLYPVVIFILFSLIKFINHKLHILFDGEELLEDDKNKDDEAAGTDKSQCPSKETSPRPPIGSSVGNIPVPDTNDLPSPDLGISLKDEIEDALNKTENNDSDNNTGRPSVPEVADNSQSNAELITTTPTCSPVERAFVVDLQCTKIEYSDKEEKKPTEVQINEANTESSSVIPEVPEKYVDEKNDDNLIIANKPTVSSDEFENIPSTTVKSDKDSHSYPLSSSTESSWGSSSESSTFIDDLVAPRVKFMPIDPSETPKQSDNADISGKSEIVLSTRKKELHVSDDKAASLPALELKDSKRHSGGRGSRHRSNNHVGFSLQEIEKSTRMKDESQNMPGTSKSDPDKIMGVSEENDGSNSPCISAKMFSDNDVSNPSDDKTTSGSNRLGQIIRTGAIRESTSAGGLRASGSRHAYSLSRRRQRTSSGSPATSLLRQESDPNDANADLAKHLAMSYEDTSTGAVHCFQDEFGQWYAYTFGEESNLQPIPRSFITDSFSANMPPATPPRRESNTSSLLSHQDIDRSMRIPDEDYSILPVQWRTHPFYAPHLSGTSIVKVEEPAPKKYYMLPIVRSYAVKVSFDRLKLLALLDRNKNTIQSGVSVLLATLVAYLGYVLLSRNFFYDFWLFVMCFVIAKCQFSLLKSVQPDSASPIHGHNNNIVFSRSVYFCIVAVLIILIDDASTWNQPTITLYTIPLHSQSTLLFARDLMIGFLLAFPLIFLLGLLPQVNTFIMHCIEQFDIHIFGGSAMTSLLASLYAFMRAIVCVTVLAAMYYIPLKVTEEGKPRGQHVLFSIFSGMLLATSYHLSRSTSCPQILWKALKQSFCCKAQNVRSSQEDINDPLPEKLLATVKTRLVNDMIVCVAVGFVVFAVHVSTAFTTLQPTLSYVMFALTGAVGVLTHYVFPQLRKQLPWLFVSSPVLKSYEYNLYEWQEHSRIMCFEKFYVVLAFVEKNVLYPIVWLSAVTRHADEVTNKFGEFAAAVIITVTSLKFLRSSFMNTPRQHIILIWTVLFFEFDYQGYSESFLIDYFFMAIFVEKMTELYLKFKFILTYTAPWQITWGSAFHAFAQPVSVPHCGMLMVQAIVSAFFSAPLNPFLGSAIFMTSYMRPIKFWEKDYNTKRVDHSNTRLSSHIDSNPGADDNNLNSIFYEHLTRSLQHSLCGDLALGRWGNFSSGDCFIMASDYLNALVHIIEVGNGYVTFQLRGLEFRGTYCQQREVEAITESVDDDEGCCCFQPGHLKNLLSFNAAFGQRWLAWEVVQSKYILEGYSVSDNTAVTMFQMFDLRKIFITYYVTSIVFYCVRNEKLLAWLSDDTIMSQLEELKSSSYVDLDTVFRPVTDKDYDLTSGGVTRHSFCQSYHDWLVCCNKHRPDGEKIEDDGADSRLVTLCFALSLLGRRLLSTASNNQWNAALKSFLHGLHALFKGDFRVTASKDEWVFADADLALLRMVVAPAVRMALKLHQDHFTCVDEFEDNDVLYETISSHEQQFVICHEGHPAWRQAVLNNRSNLLALRYVIDDGTDDYKIIMLNRRCLNFRVIKVNKECVRGLWAGQLQELIFLRNRNPERGSIQNAKQALRNMINSSCDQPIGYPIYVSPLTTSYSESNPFYNEVCVGNVNGKNIRNFFTACWRSIVNQYAGHCRGGSNRTVEIEMSAYATSDLTAVNKSGSSRNPKGHTPIKSVMVRTGSYTSIPSSSNHSTATASSHGEPSENTTTAIATLNCLPSAGKVQITDIMRVTEALDCDIHVRLQWPSNIAWLRDRCTVKHWDGWFPHETMIGDILHTWKPNDEDKNKRSHLSKSIYLLRIEDNVVPILQDGFVLLDDNMDEIKL